MRICFSLLLMIVGISTVQGQMETPTFEDIDYVGNGDQAQFLDIYLPEGYYEPRPAIVYIHGGAWRQGAKGGAPRLLYRLLNEHGYILIDINYRLSKQASYPAQIQDCKTAIRFLRENAEFYNIDPCRIGVLGKSAGGQLAALLALSQDVDELEGFDQGYANQSSNIQAVAYISGIGDFLTLDASFEDYCPTGALQDRPNSAVTHFLGCQISECVDIAQQASPITYIDDNEPPFMMHHGAKDCKSPVEQSKLLYNTLIDNGNESILHIYPDAGHVGIPSDLLIQRLTNFFLDELGSPIDCGEGAINATLQIENVNTWRVFPNPSTDHFFLEFNNFDPASEQTVSLLNSNGVYLRSIVVPSSLMEIDISDLPAGMYIIQLRTQNRIQIEKLIKQ